MNVGNRADGDQQGNGDQQGDPQNVVVDEVWVPLGVNHQTP